MQRAAFIQCVTLMLPLVACATAPRSTADPISPTPRISTPHPAATGCVAGHRRALASLTRGHYPLLAVPRTGWLAQGRELAKTWNVDVRWVTRAAVRDDNTYEAACFNLTVLDAIERRVGEVPPVRGVALFCGTKSHSSYFAGMPWRADESFGSGGACDAGRRRAIADIDRGELVQLRSSLRERDRILAEEHAITIRDRRPDDPFGEHCYAQEMENAILARQGPFVFINALERSTQGRQLLL
jgi:hypothetical protein